MRASNLIDTPATNNTMESTKGFLFEIKSSNGEVVGYLFGTIHSLNKEHIARLDQRVLECFDRSSRVFFEIDVQEKCENVQEYWETECLKHPSMDPTLINQYMYRDVEGHFLLTEPEGIDEYLYNKARIQKKLIKPLEVMKDHAKRLSGNNTSDENSDKIWILTRSLICKMLVHYNKLQNIDTDITVAPEDKPDVAIENLSYILQVMLELLKMQKYLDKEMRSIFEIVARSVSPLLVDLGLLPQEMACLIVNALEIKTTQEDQWTEKAASQLTEMYVRGDSNILCYLTPFMVETECDELFKEKMWMPTQQGDVKISTVIDEDLVRSQKEKTGCGFYALGAAHILDAYPNNVVSLLGKKGWRIEKVDLTNVSAQQERAQKNKDNFTKRLLSTYNENIAVKSLGIFSKSTNMPDLTHEIEALKLPLRI